MKIKHKFKKGEIAGFRDGNKTIFVKIMDIKHNKKDNETLYYCSYCNWELAIPESRLIKLQK